MTISVQAVYLFALLFPFLSMYTQFVLPPVMSCMHIVPFLMLVILLLLLLLHPFNGLFSRTTWISQYQKGDTSLDLNEARDNAVLGCSDITGPHMQTICTLLQTDYHTNTSSLNFYRLDALPNAQPTVSKH